MRGLRTASPNPTDPQGLHRPALRRQARQSDHLPQGILPEVGEGKFFRIKSRSPFTGRRRRSRVTDAATVAAGGSATRSHLGFDAMFPVNAIQVIKGFNICSNFVFRYLKFLTIGTF